jgi:uncharacterized protein YecE (DUF72 family)
VLVQFGPAHARDDATLGRFLAAMPAWIPVAVEFRHPTWHVEDVFAILKHHGGGVLRHERRAAPVRAAAHRAVCLRPALHGPGHHLYGGSYSSTDLIWWAERIREWAARGANTLAYFNNDGDANAVRNARTFRGMLGS